MRSADLTAPILIRIHSAHCRGAITVSRREVVSNVGHGLEERQGLAQG